MHWDARLRVSCICHIESNRSFYSTYQYSPFCIYLFRCHLQRLPPAKNVWVTHSARGSNNNGVDGLRLGMSINSMPKDDYQNQESKAQNDYSFHNPTPFLNELEQVLRQEIGSPATTSFWSFSSSFGLPDSNRST